MNKILLATSLGDGSINKHYVLSMSHCIQQKEYISWKRELINSQINCSELKYCLVHNKYEQYSFYTRTNKSNEQDLKEIYEKLYKTHNHKYFSKEIVNEMDWFCFAILYMDDGSLVAKKKNGRIHAYDLNIAIYGEKEECENLIEKLATFGLRFTLKFNKGKYSIRCGTKSARKFLEYIKPHCPNLECFKSSKFKETITDSSVLKEQFN